MRQKSNSTPALSETLVRNIRRATRKHHAPEEKIRIVLDGLRGETSIAELCRREGIAESIYYSWSKEFLEDCITERMVSLVKENDDAQTDRERNGFNRVIEYPKAALA